MSLKPTPLKSAPHVGEWVRLALEWAENGATYAKEKEWCTMNDIKSPVHYQVVDGIEAIDLIREVVLHLGISDPYAGYLLGNVLKYRLRAGKKDDALKDLAKAGEYEEMYNKYMQQLRDDGWIS